MGTTLHSRRIGFIATLLNLAKLGRLSSGLQVECASTDCVGSTTWVVPFCVVSYLPLSMLWIWIAIGLLFMAVFWLIIEVTTLINTLKELKPGIDGIERRVNRINKQVFPHHWPGQPD